LSAAEQSWNREEHLAAMLDGAPNPVIGLQADGGVAFWNRAAETMFGIGKAQAIGQPLSLLLSIVDAQVGWAEFLEKQADCADEGNKEGVQSHRWQTLQIRSIAGKTVDAELAIETHRQHEQLYATLYLREQVDNLRLAKEIADDAASAKSAFLVNMSHEIRTPMNGIIGMLDLLLDSKLSDAQREFAAIAQSSAENLLDLVNGIFDFSKNEAGRLPFESMPYDLPDEIEVPPFLGVAQETATQAYDGNRQLQLGGYKILVADDNVVNQTVVVRMLEKFGCKIELANDGAQAVALHRAHQFDLILMDCQMPEQDGYQATARIRAYEAAYASGVRVPIVALTAHAMTGERAKCLAAGMDDFLAKPVRPATLRAVLGYWLRATPVVGAQIEAGAPSDDLTAMREMFGSDFAELALLFQTDSKKRIAGMYEAVSKRDYGETIRIAHALSGSAASMGASSLAFLCKTFEAQLKSGLTEHLEAKVKAIETDYAKIDERLRYLLKTA